MQTSVALARVRDGADTLIRELGLPDAPGIPAHSDLTGVHRLVPEYSANTWSGNPWVGFFLGKMWLLSQVYPEGTYGEVAEEITRRVAKPLADGPITDENAAFDIFYGMAVGYNVTGEQWYRDSALRALGHVKSMFRPELGLFASSTTSDEVVIDTPAPLLGYLWAGKFDAELRHLLKGHMDRVLELGLLPENGQAFQGVQLDGSGKTILRKFARQGYLADSHWTRAQAWGIHNYLNGYDATGDQAHLAASMRAAEWFWQHLPENKVNYYDYDDPGAPTIPWDTCSSLIAASSFIRYGRMDEVTDGHTWRERGASILERVFADHVTLGGTVIHGSWGNARARNLGRFPQEDVMCYGNYFFVEALFRLHQDDWSALSLHGPHGR